jgi:hypothetical protein
MRLSSETLRTCAAGVAAPFAGKKGFAGIAGL